MGKCIGKQEVPRRIKGSLVVPTPRGTSSLPALVPVGGACLLGFHFVLRVMVLIIDFYWIVCLVVRS